MSSRSLLCSGWSRFRRAASSALLLTLTAVTARSAIVINEVDADTPGTDALEFVELYNTDATPVTLTDHVLVFFNGSNDLSYSTLSLSSLTVPGNGYVVIGNTGVANVGAVTFAGNFLQNGQDAVALYSGMASAAAFPNNTPVATPPLGAVLVDAVVYDTADADDPSLIAALTPGQPQIDEGASGGPAEANSISRVPDGGTPLVTTTYIAKAPTPGASNGSAAAAVLTLAVEPSTFVEDGSTGTVTGTVTRTGSTAAALTVTLTSANPAEATVPATVEIGIGQTQQTFTVTAIDELVADGNKTFDLSAAAPGFTTVTRSITVQDNEVALTTLAVTTDASSMAENATLTGSVARPSNAPSLNLPLTVNLTSSNPAKATVTASVVIPANDLFTSFTITGVPDNVFGPTVNVTFTASAPGYTNGTASVAVTNVDPAPPAPAPTVVVNKMFNAGTTADTFELLVIGNGTSGTLLDMRGMFVKDFSGSMGSDGGGKFRFNDVPLFATLKVGTLLVIDATGTSTDSTYTDASDFTLRLSLVDTEFFTKVGTGTFDIGATDMVMIKNATSDATGAGVAGGIHLLGSGTAGSLFTSATCAKLIATSTIGTNTVTIATNPNLVIADFDGTAAAGGLVPATVGGFGFPNNASNNGYIRLLRGIGGLSGVGLATITNNTAASPYLGKNIFGRGLSGQKVGVSVTSDVTPNGTLTRISVEMPASLGIPTPGNVTVTGAGAGTPVVSISDQTISVTGTAVTVTNPAVIEIDGLATPSPTGNSADGNYPFIVSSAGPTGSVTPIQLSPAAVVIIPIESLRDVDPITGIALDLNKTVAVEGVVTAPNFNNTQLSSFIQDGNFGMNIFNTTASTFTPLVRGNRIVVTGRIIQFAGLTEISPSFPGDIVDLGPGTPPVPLVVTPLEISAPLDAQALENLEGRLIKVQGLTYVSGTWADPTPPATPTSNNINDVILKDAGGNNITIRIAAATTANTPPTRYPASITGILSQAAPATSTNLFTGYILMPRDPADLELDPIVSGYSTWAAAYPGIGTPDDDADGDGQSNYLEYALGTVPDNRTSVQPMVVSMSGGKPALSITKGMAASADPNVFYQIQGTPDLINWDTPTTPETPLEEVTNTAEILTVRYLGTSAKYYFRLKAGPPPP